MGCSRGRWAGAESHVPPSAMTATRAYRHIQEATAQGHPSRKATLSPIKAPAQTPMCGPFRAPLPQPMSDPVLGHLTIHPWELIFPDNDHLVTWSPGTRSSSTRCPVGNPQPPYGGCRKLWGPGTGVRRKPRRPFPALHCPGSSGPVCSARAPLAQGAPRLPREEGEAPRCWGRHVLFLTGNLERIKEFEKENKNNPYSYNRK